MLIIHNDIGTTYGPIVYSRSVRRERRVSGGLQNYTLGRLPPNYPVPAIRYQVWDTGKGLVLVNANETDDNGNILSADVIRDF